MRIGINARLLLKRKSGIGYFTERVYEALAVHASGSKVFYYTDDSFTGIQEFGLSKINSRQIRKPLYLLWLNTIFKNRLRRDKIDVLLSPNYTPPINPGCKSVVVFHDLAYFKVPHVHPNKLYRDYMKWALPRIAKRADHIIAASIHTKKDIIDIIKVPAEKISVVYQAPSNRFSSNPGRDVIDSMMKKYRLSSKYILFAGSIDERKNLETAIDALSLYKKDTGDSGVKLVLAGKEDMMPKYTRRLKAYINQKKMNDSIIFTGYISEDELIALYWGASALIFPSLYEGFGVPPLEAMLAGVPVIASDISSIPELVGNAGLLIKPGDITGFAEAINTVLNSEKTAKELIEKGRARVMEFSWDKTGKEIYSILQRVVDE